MASCLAPFITSSSSSLPSFRSLCYFNSTGTKCKQQRFTFPCVNLNGKLATLPLSSTKRLVIRASEYKFPDPIPQFADAVSFLSLQFFGFFHFLYLVTQVNFISHYIYIYMYVCILNISVCWF